MKANARSRDGEANETSLPNRISGITVRGFKSIYTEQRLDIRPLTLLAGANSSGKSSMLQPLLLLKQTLEAPNDPGALLLDGPNVRFTRSGQLLSGVAGRPNTQEFLARIDLLQGDSVELLFEHHSWPGFEVKRMVCSNARGTTVITPRMSNEDIERLLPVPITKVLDKEREDVRWKVERDRCFLTIALGLVGPAQGRFGVRGVNIPPSELITRIQETIHLAANRGNPQRTYPRTAAGGPSFSGTFEPYVASLIARWQTEIPENRWWLVCALKDMGLTWKVVAKSVDDTQVELKVGRLPHGQKRDANDLVNIADAGFGLSQALPVVVALIAAKPGQFVYIEQPEIHLHPLAQRRLANVLLHAVDSGAVVVIETHSILLLRAVQTLVATGRLSPNDVALHWFQRDEKGQTQVHQASLDDTGAYGDWPEDFDRTELEAERDYLDAVESRRRTR